MDDNMKSTVSRGGEQVPVNEIEKAVKTLAEQKQRAFGPGGADLFARKTELQRQKTALHTPLKGTPS